MGDKLRREVIQLYYSFDNTDDLYEKGFIWSIFSYFSDLYPNEEDVQQMFRNISRKSIQIEKEMLSDEKKFSRQEKSFMRENKRFFHKYIPYIKENYKDEMTNFSVKERGYLKMLMETFLQNLSLDFYYFYKKMVNEERLILANENQVAFSSLDKSDTFIFYKKFDNVFDVMVLVHELAHSYYYYLNNEKLIDRKDLNKSIKEEIPSRMVELLFINYLNSINLMEFSIKLKNEYDNDLSYYNTNRNSIVNIKYLIGTYLAYQFCEKYTIEEYFRYVCENDFQNLLMEANESNVNNKGKVLVK